MIEIIPSEWMRNYLKDRRIFSDKEKATMIWNSPIATWDEKLDSLKELALLTDDDSLKRQIAERIEHEKNALLRFSDSAENSYIYVVKDDRRYATGYFNDYDLARQYGIKDSKEYDYRCFYVEKQLPYGEKTKDKVASYWVSKRLPCKWKWDQKKYQGTYSAEVTYKANGEILLIISNEMTDEENELVDIYNKTRFEYPFFKIPCGLEKGTIVRIINGTVEDFAVVDSGEDSWNEYMAKTDEHPGFYDFSDIQTIVFTLEEDGHWTHCHINPMHLEPDIPNADETDEKSVAYKDAYLALSEYFKTKTKESNHKAILASRHYADVCGGAINVSRWVYETDNIEKIIF